jgi:hypothetical protein
MSPHKYRTGDQSLLPKNPHQIVKTKLPSTGKTVSFRPMQGREEKILLMAKESEDGKEILSTVIQIVNNCMLDQDVADLPIFDIEWLFIQIRIASVSPTSPVSYLDRSDGKRYDFDVDLREVKIDVPAKDWILKVDDKVGIEMRYPPAAAFIDPGVTAAESDADVSHFLAIKSIQTVYDGDQAIKSRDVSPEELDEFVSSLPIDVYQKLLGNVAEIPSLEYRINYTNSKGEEREVVLNNLTDFFRFR